jgi:hypothetical protein
MVLLKRTYSLPEETVVRFEAQVPAGERSSLLAGLVNDWLSKRHRQQLRAAIAEGCAAMADLYLEIERDYHPLEEEVHSALDESAPRRNRARAPRSRRRVRASR